MALPLNPQLSPVAGWTVQNGEAGNQNLVSNAGAAPMAHVANAAGTDTVTDTTLNTLLGELQSIGLMKTS